MNQKDLTMLLQSALNKQGERLTVDGVLGPVTQRTADKYDIQIVMSLKKVITNPVVTPSLGDFGAPWVFANIDLLGLDETDPRLNARYVPEWKLEGLPSYKTLAGNTYAWCSVKVNADLRKVGIKGTNNAGASSWSRWGRKSPFWFGSVLDIAHYSGGRHVCFFLYWIDEAKGICATMDGNKGNLFCIARTDISGKGKADRLVSGPRWSNDLGDGQLVSMKDVLAKYPYLKVGSNIGGSTR